jgi:hypothetical protein
MGGIRANELDYEDGTTFSATTDNSIGEHEDQSLTPSLFVWLLTFSAGISGLLFGCSISSF